MKQFFLCTFLSFLMLPHVPGQVASQDSLALVAIYQATNGPEWTVDSNWLTGPVPSWHGVTVTGDRVTNLGLYSNNLTDSLPPAIGDLTALERLEVSSNALTGQLPGTLGQLTELTHLDVHFNMITGTLPATLVNCTRLKTIIAYRNNLSGGFPSVLLEMPQLERILLGSNDLEGQIPPEINTLVNLRNLTFERNNFSGVMPSIANLVNLSEVHMRENNLEGNWQDIIGYHPEMYYFTFNDNNFTGCVSDTSFNPDQLQFLHLNNNNFDCLGDFSAFADTGVLQRIWCGNNQIPFEYLEKNTAVGIYEYAPQDSLLQPATHELATGATISIDAGTGGDHTSYTWYHNGVVIDGATGRTLTITDFQPDDAGAYYCAATNSMLPDLTLYRSVVHLQPEGTTGTRDHAVAAVLLYPNPATAKVWLKGLSGQGTVDVYDATGTLRYRRDMSLDEAMPVGQWVAGLYSLVIRQGDRLYISRLVKE
ncbi:MAG: T9SS type A sorting domain-containing protein [Saprospiraceae bacterium]|nr:T9SS type A sorting domain-containing protein [Saprospiraceae bacterium]